MYKIRLYEKENYAKFWAIIIPFESQSEAEAMLLQYGVFIA